MSAPTAPGVHVLELPGGSRAITGVATSLTAFVGPALRGPVHRPVRIASWPEYESRFGGLWHDSTASHAVRHYFLGGGGEALIVRVTNADRMVLQVSPDAAALSGFHHLRATVDKATATTFTLRLQAEDADGAVLKKGDKPYQVDGVVDLTTDQAATVNGLKANDTPLVKVLGGPLTGPPPTGAVTSTAAGGGQHVVTLGAAAETAGADVAVGLRLRPTPGVLGLAGFDRLRATVARSDDGTFRLTVTAVQADGAPLKQGDKEYTVSVDAVTPGTAATKIGEARTGTDPAIPLATVTGIAPPSVPPDGSADGSPHGDLLLATQVLRLQAADPGEWGNRVSVEVDTEEAEEGTFHLRLGERSPSGGVVAEEVHYGVSTDPTASRWLGRLLELQSRLARLARADVAGSPTGAAGATVFAGGRDGGSPRIDVDVLGDPATSTGVHALAKVDLFNLLCVPLPSWSEEDAVAKGLWDKAATFCTAHRAFLLIDPPEEWNDPANAVDRAAQFGVRSDNAALYYPRVRVPDPLQEGRFRDFPPCGVVAGAFARTDAQRGIWKAPAGIDTSLRGVTELAARLVDEQQGVLNALGVNCLRTFPVYGQVVWGARTLNGADLQVSEWKYVPVRRLALHLEESLQRGSRWAVFEPNGPGLWSQLRLSVGSFLHGLFRQGAFAGTTAQQAYFVRCDAETTTESDVARGVVNVLVGFAPLKPAEFVVIRLQQLAAQAGQ
ncbi:phage tail sheath family protein [Pseudonocardia sp.]|uniref:phage tail sheath family protein n=1 Tax=Pseudonocardia sp. TaxID=60912 RepID=UPI003D136F45